MVPWQVAVGGQDIQAGFGRSGLDAAKCPSGTGGRGEFRWRPRAMQNQRDRATGHASDKMGYSVWGERQGRASMRSSGIFVVVVAAACAGNPMPGRSPPAPLTPPEKVAEQPRSSSPPLTPVITVAEEMLAE